MFERLDQTEAKYEELTKALASPEVINDSAKYQKTAKAHSELTEIVEKYREYKDLKRGIQESRAIIADEADAELREYAQEELGRLEVRLAKVEDDLKLLLVPKDPNDEKNVVLEIRAGTGGDEATLFAAEIFRMYNRYAEGQRWKVEVLSTSESGVGGLKEVIAIIEGRGVYSRMKYESGVHRVQRVPQTEQQGRVHREKGMRVLRARLYEMEMEKQQQALAKERKAQVGTGDRSEKIRTYNFPQNRVTDHRIGLTLHQLSDVMDGKLHAIFDALATHFQAEKLKQQAEVVA